MEQGLRLKKNKSLVNSPLEKGVRGLLHSEIKSIDVINEKIGIVRRFYTKYQCKDRINIRLLLQTT